MRLSAQHKLLLIVGAIGVAVVLIASVVTVTWYRSAAEQRRDEEAKRAEKFAMTPVDDSKFDLCKLVTPSMLPSLDWAKPSPASKIQYMIDRNVRWSADVGGTDECRYYRSWKTRKQLPAGPGPSETYIQLSIEPDLGWGNVKDADSYDKFDKSSYIKRDDKGSITALTRLPHHNFYVTVEFPETRSNQEKELSNAVRQAKRRLPDSFRMPGRQASGICADMDQSAIVELLGGRPSLTRSTDSDLYTSCAYAASNESSLTIEFDESPDMPSHPLVDVEPADLKGFQLATDANFAEAASSDGRKVLTASANADGERTDERLKAVVNAALKAKWG